MKVLLRQDLILAALLIMVIILMIVPVPQFIIDSLIGFNIALGILLLMVGIYLRQPSDFSTFPSVILIGTAFRLAISIATTRMILTEADAGQIINTFGSFVISGNLIVGLVIFLIITIVQFIVITKGAERVAEVAARFCLDAMPGKQMSIDAEVRAGTIDQEEGNRRRQKLDKDNQFFGAMDGAMKFVKGDAIAGLVITAVNLIGGIAVGMIIHNYSLGQSIQVYSLLTVGDGLVAQIPALFISMCAATIITRVTHSENEDLGTEIFLQLASDRRALFVAAAAVLGLGLVPGFPWFVFIVLSGSLALLALLFARKTVQDSNPQEQDDSATHNNSKEVSVTVDTSEDTTDYLPEILPLRMSDRIILYVGNKLLADIEKTGAYQLREELSREWNEKNGLSFPAFSIKESSSLSSWELRVDFDNVPAMHFVIPNDSLLLACDLELKDLLPAEAKPTTSSWVGQTGFWIPEKSLNEIENIDSHIVTPGNAVVEATFNVQKKFVPSLFSRVELGYFFGVVEDKDPTMVQELAETLGISGLQDILRRLIEDRVPLKPQRLVMETLHQWMYRTKDISSLVEAVRMALKRQICFSLADENNIISAVVLDPSVEKAIRQAAQNITSLDGIIDKSVILDSRISEKVLNRFYTLQSSPADRSRSIAVVTAPDIRRAFRNFLNVNNIHLPVISYQEISAEVKVHPVSMIRLKEGDAQARRAA